MPCVEVKLKEYGYIDLYGAHELLDAQNGYSFNPVTNENEGNIKVIQEIMGHATYETTLNIYTDISEMRKEKAMEELASKLEK